MHLLSFKEELDLRATIPDREYRRTGNESSTRRAMSDDVKTANALVSWGDRVAIQPLPFLN
jgi:hypothetical protein